MITGVEIEAFCHPTEDLSLVKSAFELVAGKGPEISRTTTHFGAEILVLRARLTRRPDIERFLGIISRLPKEDKNFILNNLDTYLDDRGNLHLRFDKFRALNGELRLGAGEAVKATVKFTTFPLDISKIKREVEELFG